MTDIEFVTKLTEKTRKNPDLWVPVDSQAYKCSFNTDKITFSFEFSEEERETENKVPELFILVFTTPEDAHYKQIFVSNYQITNNPLVGAFQNLYQAIKVNEEKTFINKCSAFFKEEN